MPLLTLTSDFGDQDYVLGIVKGILYKHLPSHQQIDITHRLIPFNDAQAASVIKTSLNYFPEGTIHIVLSNFFQHSPDQIILLKHKNQFLAMADNGLIGMIIEGEPDSVSFISLQHLPSRSIPECMEELAKGLSSLEAGDTINAQSNTSIQVKQRAPLRLQVYDDGIEGQILYVDQFENVVVNISREEFEFYRKGRGFKIVFRRDEIIDRISLSYADVPEGNKLALFNTSGYLEIAVNKGNAAGLFGLHKYDEKNKSLYAQNRLFYHSVKIFFE